MDTAPLGDAYRALLEAAATVAAGTPAGPRPASGTPTTSSRTCPC